MDKITGLYIYLYYAKFLNIQKENKLDAEITDILWNVLPYSRQDRNEVDYLYEEEDPYQEEDLENLENIQKEPKKFAHCERK